MSVTNAREFQMAFSLNKQSAIGTAVTASQINKRLPQRGFAPVVQEFPDQASDRQHYGKGHSHPTYRDLITKRLMIPAREFSMTQLSALFAPAFVLGSLSSSRPNSASAPTVWDHSLTFQDPSDNVNALWTSFIEKAGAEYQKKIHGGIINSFSVRAERNDHVVLGWEGFARKMEDDATDLSLVPLATGQSFFKLLGADIRFAASGGSYATRVSADVLSLALQVSQNAQGFWLPGAASSEEALLSKALIGDQVVSGSMSLFLDATRRALFLNDTECEVRVTFVGGQITGSFYHTATVTIPHFKISSESFGEEGGTTQYTMNFDENSVLKSASDPFIQWDVRSTIDNTEVLVEA